MNQQLLIAGRVVQGIGAAGLSPAAMSLLLVTFPAAQRARAMGRGVLRRRWVEPPGS